MSGQHVGSLSDSINNEDELRAAMRDRVKIKPTGRTFHGVSTSGDGDPCPSDADRPADERHGKMYVINGRQWCPHQTHDNERIVKP